MKASKLLVLTILASSVFYSCKKKEDTPKEEEQEEVVVTATDGVLNCKLEESLWESSTANGVYESEDHILRIKGEKSGDESIEFVIVDMSDNFEGTFDLGTGSSSTCSYQTSSEDYSTFSATGGGSVTITSFDTINKLVTGSFNFIATPFGSNKKKTATNGLFTKISFTE